MMCWQILRVGIANPQVYHCGGADGPNFTTLRYEEALLLLFIIIINNNIQKLFKHYCSKLFKCYCSQRKNNLLSMIHFENRRWLFLLKDFSDHELSSWDICDWTSLKYFFFVCVWFFFWGGEKGEAVLNSFKSDLWQIKPLLLCHFSPPDIICPISKIIQIFTLYSPLFLQIGVLKGGGIQGFRSGKWHGGKVQTIPL